MKALKLPSGKILNVDFFNDIVCISTIMKLNENGKFQLHSDINYIINITFPGNNNIALSYIDEKLAIADLNFIEKYLIPESSDC